jgi:type II secretory pathway pseudopilin PulG
MEVIVALGLLAVVITPASLLFIRSMQSSKLDEQRQAAAMVANETLEVVRSRNPTTLLNGRKASDVDAQWKNPGPINLANANEPTLVDTNGTTVVPATPQFSTVAGVKYTVNTIIGICYAPTSTTNSTTTSCDKTNSPGTSQMYRVAVSVTWNAGHGYSCSGNGGLCSVVADTLIDPALSDPLFNNNT